jgi:hypothetical protein
MEVVMKCIRILVPLALSLAFASQARAQEIIHDAEYYILEAQHGEDWARQEAELDKRLATLRDRYGKPPNIIHMMWDDTPVGEIGIPEIQKIRGWETPNLNRLAAKGMFNIMKTRHLAWKDKYPDKGQNRDLPLTNIENARPETLAASRPRVAKDKLPSDPREALLSVPEWDKLIHRDAANDGHGPGTGIAKRRQRP